MATNNNNKDLDIVEAIQNLAKERELDQTMLLSTVEDACKAAFRKTDMYNTGAPMDISIVIARKQPIQVIARKMVVSEVTEKNTQISLEEAREIRPDYMEGDIVEINVTPKDFGRVAAQTAKQVLVQRLREAERGKIYNEYIEKENEILTAIVQQVDSKGVSVVLGRTEGVMEPSEYMPGEEYRVNDHIKVYVLQVQRSRSAMHIPQVYVSRIHPGLVKRLFEMEVPEIASGVVQIKSIAREAGSRTKMAVYSSDVSIDPVGACVGPRGSRVEKVIAELNNEKIDIIKWSQDPAEFVANALNPAHVLTVFVSDAEKICRVVVPDSQLSLAIGKEGQNARLAAKLTGWKIDIKSETQFRENLDEQGMTMEDVFGPGNGLEGPVDYTGEDVGYEDYGERENL